MPFLSTNGVNLHYQIIGEGPALLLLAGMMSDGASWTPVIEPLSRSNQLIVIDNRCTGQSTPRSCETSRELMLDDIVAVLETLSLESVAVLGHSMGAMLAWALAARTPERINRIIVAAGLPIISPARIDLFESLAKARHTTDQRVWYHLLFQWLFKPSFFDEASHVESAIDDACQYPFQQQAEAFEQQVKALSTFDSSVQLSNISCPVHCMTGANDLLLPPATLLNFYKSFTSDSSSTALASSPLREPVIIESAAHALHWEQPEAFVTAVQNALSEGAR